VADFELNFDETTGEKFFLQGKFHV